MKGFSLIVALCLSLLTPAIAQHELPLQVLTAESDRPLEGATVVLAKTGQSGITNSQGLLTLTGLLAGQYVVICRFLGFETLQDTVTIPLSTPAPRILRLVAADEELEEVFITATRSSRTIADLPTRVEAISGEELEEKGNMKPGDIRMLLNETTGIQTQQTSATSYNSSIRIQGLDGKYTQLLRDGFPLYAGFSGGLSLLQIAPLDLQQVEVIKGASSTLYGGGAIAGLVNLVSKQPTEDPELSLLLNATSAAGFDASGFFARRGEKFGATVFASLNHGSPYDPAGIGLTAIPQFNRYTVSPRFFAYLNERSTLQLGVSHIAETRTGGDLAYIEGTNPGGYFEENKTSRWSTQLAWDQSVNEQTRWWVKNSLNYYDRQIATPGYSFAGLQTASFSELGMEYATERADWVAGVNLWTDGFTQDGAPGNTEVVDYQQQTVGAFVQQTWQLREEFSLETGLRLDWQNDYGVFLLPRFSAFYKLNTQFSLRLGGGLGYKTPTVFAEDAERIQFQGVLPIDVDQMKAERSSGLNFDINYRTTLGSSLGLQWNTLFFFTRVNDPLLLEPTGADRWAWVQPSGNIETRGIETNLKWTLGDFKLFIGYTLADVQQENNGSKRSFPLVARHRLNNVLMYEMEESWKIGLEAYYFSPQPLNDNTTGQAYWICGLMAEKIWEKWSLFLNFENFLDTRQTRFDTIFTGSRSNPQFRDIYAPVDGFVINGGVKIRL